VKCARRKARRHSLVTISTRALEPRLEISSLKPTYVCVARRAALETRTRRRAASPRFEAMSTRALTRLLHRAVRPSASSSAPARRRLSTVDASTGAGIDDVLHQHAREDMYFRAEDVRLLQGLVNKAHAQARARSAEKAQAENAEAHDLAALEAIVGKGTLSEATARAVVAWKRG